MSEGKFLSMEEARYQDEYYMWLEHKNFKAPNVHYYRIVEEKNGKYYSLFHGTNGSRELPLGRWVEAGDGPVTNPGKGGTEFEQGFHVLRSEEEVRKYLKRFTSKRKEQFRVGVVAVDKRGNWPKVWNKPTKNSPSLLTKRMMLVAVI